MGNIGLFKLGFVKNIRPNDNGENCITTLSKMLGQKITLADINEYIESPNFIMEHLDTNDNPTDEGCAFKRRFKIPWKSKNGDDVFGVFERKGFEEPYVGVIWSNGKSKQNAVRKINLFEYGYVSDDTWEILEYLSGFHLDKYSIQEHISSPVRFYNRKGDIIEARDNAYYIRFDTDIKTTGDDYILGWYTKELRGFTGITWGTKHDFENFVVERSRLNFLVGKMSFKTKDDCNIFLENLKKKTIPEPWGYKKKLDSNFNYPILKSYLQFELERLFYEQFLLNYPDRIIYNDRKNKILYNTNLIDKYGHDLTIVGDLIKVGDSEYISDLEISPSKKTLSSYGFAPSVRPLPPKFFLDINEIIFHCDWEIDKHMEKYEHIIEERIDRFPSKYRDYSTDDLGLKLDNAIDFAKRIAQRNYKFIVPKYDPRKKIIQLLMPIYLETSFTAHPDFALVLTPEPKDQLYTPETILGLDEVYQDARLIATPEQSWLNPDIIE